MDQTQRIEFYCNTADLKICKTRICINIYLDRKIIKRKKKQQLPEPIILVRANTSGDKLKTQKKEYVTIELLNFQQNTIICMVL